ncbi:insulin receptor substrate 2-B isoform X2 [Amia ocellicauda]|uniref:insulin receptor substrate 2-B isoform X2 n=1 Tax=Amia ocellicauda TaxID=2972642 RepID=UPI003463C71B
MREASGCGYVAVGRVCLRAAARGGFIPEPDRFTWTNRTGLKPTTEMGSASVQIRLQQQEQQQQPTQPQYYGEESLQEELLRRPSASSLSLVHEEAAVNTTAATVAVATTTTTRNDGLDDVRKCGYLRKQKHGHKRFFVLRGQSHLGPSRLEYYDSEKKFRNSTRSSATACQPKRVIPLYQCFTVNKRADAKNKHLIALYTKDEYFAMVAENEQEQEDWYVTISDLMNEGKKGQLESEELDDGYGTVTPGTVFKEVWQVNVKPKGLGQTKNLTGVYRLCLSSKTIHLVKLNSETPCVNLQLMNIRRCGHSESFFFIEVGRSSSIGPGEIWMQVDDSVVAQNMHETILETMKALKAFAEFRPRSKSQSSGSNPIAFITTRRHLGNLPPSQTGLQRRSRTETIVGTPPTSKSGGYRFRTSSEGEGTMSRPFRSVTGSLIHLNTARINLGRQESGGRYVRALPGGAYHTRSASLPVSHFPSTTSPVSVSSSSGHGSASDTLTRPSSASICGSPSDGGFNSSDEYGSSPGDFRYFRVRSNTPDSLGNTPPIREENCLNDYMAMDKHREGLHGYDGLREDCVEGDKSFRKCTHSFTKPGTSATAAVYQKMTQTTSSLDEPSAEASPLGSNGHVTCSASSKLTYNPYPEDYCQARPTEQHQSKSKDDGYMPMMPGVASPRSADYMPMHPKSPSVPQQIVTPRSSQQQDSQGYMMMLPSGGCSPVQICPQNSSDRLSNGEYMDMSQSSGAAHRKQSCYYSQTTPEPPKSYSSYFSLPRSYKAPLRENREHDEYVPMISPAKPLYATTECSSRGSVSDVPPSLVMHNGCGETHSRDKRAVRPTRLSLGRRNFHGTSRVCEQVEPPPSPGEYINIEYGEKAPHTPCSLSECSPSSLGSSSEHRRSPLQDYMSLEMDHPSPKVCSPRTLSVAPRNPPEYSLPLAGTSSTVRTDDYTEMTFNLGGEARSPSAMVKHLHIIEHYPSLPPPSPPIEPKVIRADPQGRRRHSSETFSSTPSVPSSAAPASSLLMDSSKRHSSASFDSVWLRVEGASSTEPSSEGGCSPSSRMCRNTSAGYQNGLNYIALDLRGDPLGCCNPAPPSSSPPPSLSENGAYASIDFSSKSDGLTAASKD